MANKLEDIRQQLDNIDHTIIKALADRQKVVQDVFNLKIDGDSQIRDLEREEKILQRIGNIARKTGLDRSYVEQLYREIINHSVRYQTQSLVDHQNETSASKTISVAYQGTEGAFSHRAALKHFKERYAQVHCYGYDSFRDAARSVEKEETDVAILPIENTTAGSINATYDVLGDGSLHIIGEEVLRIVHCLMAVEQVDLPNIRRIISHPQALSQCSRYLSRLPRCKVESYTDTAMAAKKVLEDADLSQAAIASAYAAEIYGLYILERDIANQEQNFTRFVVVGREPVHVDEQILCKTSLMMTTTHTEGDLINCLRVLGDHSINMTKIESRPRPNEPWKYLFYVDVEGNMDDPDFKSAIEKMRKRADSLNILGCYPEQVSASYTK